MKSESEIMEMIRAAVYGDGDEIEKQIEMLVAIGEAIEIEIEALEEDIQ